MRIGMRIVIIVLLSVACVGLSLAADSKQSLGAPSTLDVKVQVNCTETEN